MTGFPGVINRVLYAPSLLKNLFSVEACTSENKSIEVVFSGNQVSVYKQNIVVLKGAKQRHIYCGHKSMLGQQKWCRNKFSSFQFKVMAWKAGSHKYADNLLSSKSRNNWFRSMAMIIMKLFHLLLGMIQLGQSLRWWHATIWRWRNLTLKQHSYMASWKKPYIWRFQKV